MNISPKSVCFDHSNMWVELTDGRNISVPLAWFPRLLSASPQQRLKVSLSKSGLHWDARNEDISINGLLAGKGDLTKVETLAA